MYQVVVERHAEKDIDRLHSDVQRRVLKAVYALGTQPRPPGCRKLVGGINDWRIRVGDYRVLYEIADTIRIVRVYRVRHRREVYD